MSNPTPAFVLVSAEKTFSSYTQDQGANYAQNRTDYHPNLYKTIIDSILPPAASSTPSSTLVAVRARLPARSHRTSPTPSASTRPRA
ncbi:hypothetical protein V2W45_1340268 [Cenococcum geophilum]